jgi:NADPH:quinone reductase
VRLRAAGINPVDYKLRAGGTIGGSLPAVLGWDGAGVVESVGQSVTRVRPGDEVFFCDGGFGPTPGTYDRHLGPPQAPRLETCADHPRLS